MYTLKLALSLLHPGLFQLITVTSNVLMTYFADNFYGNMIDKIVNLNL